MTNLRIVVLTAVVAGTLSVSAAMKTPETSRHFEKFTDPVSRVVSYKLKDGLLGWHQQGLHFVNQSMTDDGRFFFFSVCEDERKFRSETKRNHWWTVRTLGVVDFATDEIRHFRDVHANAPFLDTKTAKLYFVDYSHAAGVADSIKMIDFRLPEPKAVKLCDLPGDAISEGRGVTHYSEHITLTRDRTKVFTEAHVKTDKTKEGDLVKYGFVDLKTGRWEPWGKCAYNLCHTQLCPADDRVALGAFDGPGCFNVAPGDTYPRLRLFKPDGSDRMVPPHFRNYATHEKWNPQGTGFTYAAHNCTFVDLKTGKQTVLCPLRIGHPTVSSDPENRYVTVDEAGLEEWWRGCSWRVGLWDRFTGRYVDIYTKSGTLCPKGTPKEKQSRLHPDAHPSFCCRDKYIVSTYNNLDEPRMAVLLTPVAPLKTRLAAVDDETDVWDLAMTSCWIDREASRSDPKHIAAKAKVFELLEKRIGGPVQDFGRSFIVGVNPPGERKARSGEGCARVVHGQVYLYGDAVVEAVELFFRTIPAGRRVRIREGLFLSTKDGLRPTDAAIVLPEKPTWNERYAAKELKYHLEEATGRQFPVVREGDAFAADRRLYVGAVKALAAIGVDYTTFELDARLLKGVKGDIYFVGGERRTVEPPSDYHRAARGNAGGGTLYAVYDFLEKELGVKWIWPGKLGEIIPKRADVPRLDGVERRGLEPLIKRVLRGDSQQSIRVTAANRLYGFRDAENAHREVEARREWLTRMRSGSRRVIIFGHAFQKWHKRFANRPELFAQQPCGAVFFKQASDDSNKYYPLCVSNPEVSDIIVNDWAKNLKYLKPGKRPYEINCGENDSPGFCACARCRSWDAEDEGFRLNPYWNGSMTNALVSGNRFLPGSQPAPALSDRYVRFYNTVLEKARKIRADAEVSAYAYSNYAVPPKRTRVADGINIAFVPRMIYPYTRKESDDFRLDWGGWNAMGAVKMVYRPNYMHAHVNVPFSRAKFIADDINFAWARGLIEIDQDALLGAWSAQALDNYVVARLLREPGVGYDRMLDEFLSAFGAAADDIRAYVGLLAEQAERYSAAEWKAMGARNKKVGGSAPGGGWRNWFMNVADAYREEWFAQCRAVLAKAKAKTAGAERQRVEFLMKGLEDGRLTYRTRVAQKSGDKAAFKAAFKALQDYRASIEADLVCAYLPIADREFTFANWPHPCIRYYPDRKGDGDNENNNLIDAL